MKKLLILLTGFLFATIALQAQQKHSKFFVQLSGGPSFALGRFASKNFKGFINNDDPSGMAKTGLAAQLSLGYYINESVGLLLQPGYSVHKQDKSPYEDFIKANYLSAGTAPGSSYVNTNKWKLTKLMAGGFFVTPLTESSKLALITKLTAGICKTAFPGYEYGYIESSPAPVIGVVSMQNADLPWAFCYQVSVGVKYKLNNKLHLLLDINSFNSTPSKEQTFYYPSASSSSIANPATSEQKTVKYKLAELNTLVGIGINF